MTPSHLKRGAIGQCASCLALGSCWGRACCARCCRSSTRGRAGPDVRGRPLLAEAAAEPLGPRRRRRRVGRRAGPHLDGASREQRGHPQGPGDEAALQRDVLRDRAARPGVRSGGQPAAALGTRTERSVDGRRARHPHRPQEQRVAGRRRRRRCPDPEVHDRRQVRAADREEGRTAVRAGAARRRSTIPTAWTWKASGSRRRSSSIRGPTRPMCPTATSIIAWSCWTPTPASSNACGAPTATSRTTRRCRAR